MFLLCNPHNPLGMVFSRAELTKMAEICLGNDVLIVADEIHSELLLGDQKFLPVASLAPEIAKRTITLVSASKAFNVPGLFCAFAIIPDLEIRERFTKMTERLKIHANSLGMIAAQTALSGKCDGWLKECRRYLKANRDFVVDYAARYMPGIRITVPEATYLAWLDCTQLEIDGSPYEFFLKQAKVALSDGVKFGAGGEGHVRLNFGSTRKTVRQALTRMKKALP
jgi:cystathionine beta-lyase